MSSTSKSTEQIVNDKRREGLRRNRWSLLEKSMLLRAMKLYGLRDMKSITQMVLTKDENEVRRFLRTSLKKLQCQDRQSRKTAYCHMKRRQYTLAQLREKKKNAQPLERRERVALQLNDIKSCMLKSRKEEQLPKIPFFPLSCVYLSIAKFGSHPESNMCNDVDFRALYLFLSKVVQCQYRAGKTVLPNTHTKRYVWSCYRKLIRMITNEDLFNTRGSDNGFMNTRDSHK